MNLKALLTRWWCDHLHIGGTIQRDSLGRINWQCDTCGRWSDHPVPLDEERRVVDRELGREG